MTYRVLVTDYVWPSLDPERQVLARVGAEVVAAPSGDEATLAELAAGCDGILTCFAKVTERVIDAATRCRIVARYGIGVDNIAVEAASRRGIVVTNVPAYCVDEVSDHALALLLASARKVTRYDRAARAGRWDQKLYMPVHRIRGQTLGIVGYGKIGRLVAEKARPFGLRILCFDPYQPREALARAGVELVDLPTLLRESDFITLHSPLTPETRGMIGESALAQVKPSAYLVNTSRGGLVDVDALHRALAEGRLAGAALDVLPEEPPAADHPLLGLENVVLTPHMAFYSEESLVELETKAAEEVARVLSGERPANAVNADALRRSTPSAEPA